MIPLLPALTLCFALTPCQTYQQLTTTNPLHGRTPVWNEAWEKLVESYPSCDSLYLPSLIHLPADDAVYEKYFLSAGEDPLILAAILERFDDMAPHLPHTYQQPLQLLERLFWANTLKDNDRRCPCVLPRTHVTFKGYINDYSSGCYRMTLFYSIPPYSDEHAISLSWEEPFLFPAVIPSIRSMMHHWNVPLLISITKNDTPARPARPPRRMPKGSSGIPAPPER